MKLSLLITTYNRVEYLAKNINIIITQIKQNNLQNDIEIIISDDYAPNPAVNQLEPLIQNNKDINIKYYLNEPRKGADENFAWIMQEAHAEYSILLGDDDFLIQGALAYILQTIRKHPDIPIFVSDRNNLDDKGNFIEHQKFFRNDIHQMVFDFSNIQSARSLFYSITSIGGILSFPSVVIYKTSIIQECLPYDKTFTGSSYSHQYFFWTYLLKGNKLMYLDYTFIDCTRYGQQQSNFGAGIKRTLLDYKGYALIAERIFKDSPLRQDFLNTLKIEHPYPEIFWWYTENRKFFKLEMIPALKRCGWSDDELKTLTKITSIQNAIKTLLKYFLPQSISKIIKRLLTNKQ